jgi:hypothetical protein
MANPPSNSIKIVHRDMKCGVGTPIALVVRRST